MTLMMIAFSIDGESDENEFDIDDNDIGYGWFANVLLVYSNLRMHISVFCSCRVC